MVFLLEIVSVLVIETIMIGYCVIMFWLLETIMIGYCVIMFWLYNSKFSIIIIIMLN